MRSGALHNVASLRMGDAESDSQRTARIDTEARVVSRARNQLPSLLFPFRWISWDVNGTRHMALP